MRFQRGQSDAGREETVRMKHTPNLLTRSLASSAAACVVVLGCTAPQAGGGGGPISTDRPGFLFAPTVVPADRVQVEAGLPSLALARESGDEDRVWSLPVALRYGLSETIELRASLPTWTDVRDESGASVERFDGFGDVEVGAKIALPTIASGPLALLASLRLPTGDETLTTDEFGGSLHLLAGRDLGQGYWLQGMLGLTYVPAEGEDDQTSGAIAALLSHPFSRRTSAYVEVAALPGLRHASGQAYVGGGLTFVPLERLQFDVSADFGLEEDAADLLIGLGVSWYF